MLSICLILEVAAIVVIFADDSLIRDNLKKQWDNLSEEDRLSLEDEYSCTGFDACYSKIEDGIKDNMFIVGGITIGVFVYQLVMTVFAFCLCCNLGKGRARVTMEEV